MAKNTPPPPRSWRFPTNEAGELEGKNPAIAQYSSDRHGSLIREAIQNSLDATQGNGFPVLVSFASQTLSSLEIDAPSLIEALEECVESIEDEKVGKDLLNRIELLKEKEISVLRIGDSNTIGASDEPKPKNQPSAWKALTKSTGVGDKPAKDAAGSWGFGKYAAFANSPVRTVLYSAAWEADGQLRRRYIGKTIQVSRVGRDQKEYRATGYLGEGWDSLEDGAVPLRFHLAEPGTAVYIVGYKPDGQEWASKSSAVVIKHFFHALLSNKLKVDFNGVGVNDTTIEDFECDERTQRFIGCCRSEIKNTTHIDGIGTVNLRIVVDEDTAAARRREIALVRDAGMMITDDRNRMGLPALKALPSRLLSFTAIVECLSNGEESILRQCESPEHNQVSADYIEDFDERRNASETLTKLGRWILTSIHEHADRGVAHPEETADELEPYISRSIKGRMDENASGARDTASIGLPFQSKRSPRPDSVPIPSGPGPRGKKPAPRPSSDPTPRPPAPGSGTVRPGQFRGLRFRPSGRQSSHAVRAMFDNPHTDIRELAIVASGEDDNETPLGIRQAWLNDKPLKISHGKITHIPQDIVASERYVLDIVTREPTVDRAFRLKCAGRAK